MNVRFIGSGRPPEDVPDLGDGLLGCYRCAYVWRLRKAPVRMCPRCKSTLWNTPRVDGARPRRPRGDGIEEVLGDRREAFLDLARSFGAHRLRIFGSVARREAGPKSDLDLLVEFRTPLGVLSRAEFEEKIEALIGRRVDVATEEELHWLIRPRVLSEATPV